MRLKDTIMSATQEIEKKAKEKRDAARKEEEKVKERLQAAIEKGRTREYLSAPNTEMGKNLSMVKGLQKALDIMVSSGMSKADAQKTLTDNDKALLEEHEFIEAQKKKYGKK